MHYKIIKNIKRTPFAQGMNSSKSIVKNSFFLFLGQIVTMAFSFILIIAIARYLGDVGLGKYSFAFALASLLLTSSDLGTCTLLLREVARNKTQARKYLSNVFTLNLFVLLVASAATLVFIFFTGKSLETILIVGIATAAIFLNTLTNPFRMIYTAFERVEHYSLVTAIERSLALLFGGLVLIKGFGIIALMCVFIVSYGVSFVLAWIITIKRFTGFSLEINIPLWVSFLKESIPFWLTALFMMFYFKIDTLILSAIKGYAVVGWYNAAYKLIEPLSFVPFITLGAIFPIMSRFHVQSKKMLAKLYSKSFYYLFLIAFPLSLGTTFLADRIISFIYKAQFTNSIIVLKILIWAEAILFLNYVMGYLLNSINKQKLFTYAVMVSALLNLTLNLILIPVYGYVGASAVAVVTQIINFSLLYYFCSKNNYSINFLKTIAKPLLAGIIMVALMFSLKSFHMFLIIPVAVTTYLAVLVITKGLGKEELDLVKSFLEKD